MTWTKTVLLMVQKKDEVTWRYNAISESVIAYLNYIGTADAYSYEHDPKDKMGGKGPLEVRRKAGQKVENVLVDNALSTLTLADRLMVFGHGSQDSFQHISPKEFAAMLKFWGLGQVGLMTFKACQIGVGTYLDDLKIACAHQGIQVGWFKGYKGDTRTESRWKFWSAKPYEHVTGKDWSLSIKSVPHSTRVKIVEGTAGRAVTSPRTGRYAEYDFDVGLMV